MKRLSFLFGILFMFVGVPAKAVIVASGDVTPVFSLTNMYPDVAASGNQKIFSNVLGGGNQVTVFSNSFSEYAPTEINYYYNSLADVSSVEVTAVTASALTNIDLLLIPFPNRYFETSEKLAIGHFIQGRGSLFVMGEGVLTNEALATNAIINDLLTALNIPMMIITDYLDIGYQNTSAGSHPLTTGIDSYKYGATSRVSGGTGLFFTHSGEAFVSMIIPEPATLSLLALGVMLAGRKRRK